MIHRLAMPFPRTRCEPRKMLKSGFGCPNRSSTFKRMRFDLFECTDARTSRTITPVNTEHDTNRCVRLLAVAARRKKIHLNILEHGSSRICSDPFRNCFPNDSGAFSCNLISLFFAAKCELGLLPVTGSRVQDAFGQTFQLHKYFLACASQRDFRWTTRATFICSFVLVVVVSLLCTLHGHHCERLPIPHFICHDSLHLLRSVCALNLVSHSSSMCPAR